MDKNNLKEKWFIRGGEELTKYFKNNLVLNWNGNSSEIGYYRDKDRWSAIQLRDASDWSEITLKEYKKHFDKQKHFEIY